MGLFTQARFFAELSGEYATTIRNYVHLDIIYGLKTLTIFAIYLHLLQAPLGHLRLILALS